jgi:glycosyltransferase involved in cell wall biosynthesis
MSKAATASVIVNNFNYAQFLRAAVDSALGQTYADTEVIVVDDGSTDESRRVIAGFGDRVLPILKDNGGQASAFHAGLRASNGEVIIFLDADDLLLPSASRRRQ